MYDFQKRTMFHPKKILNPQDLMQNRSVETVQPALFGIITHITILYVFTCVMDVRYQTI